MTDSHMHIVKNELLGVGVTYRQFEAASLVLKLHSNRYIADKLFIEENSVKWLLTLVYKRCGVKNRLEFAVWCYEKVLGAV